jgi:hypothetical protein
MQARQSGNMPVAIGLVVLGVIFVVMAIFYAVATTSLLASTSAHHYKHAVLFAVLAALSLIGANFARKGAI